MTLPLSNSDSISPGASEYYPFLSVIIPIYNGETDLPDLVDCLWNQDYPANRVEYLLVDNNSGDRTAELLQTFASTSQARGITLTPLQEHHIQSAYAARNRGIRSARGTILIFTDMDCRPCPQWLSRLIRPFADSSVGLVAGEVAGLPSKHWLEIYADRQKTLSQKHTLDHPFRPYGQTANLAVRRQAFEMVGIFRPYLTTGGDADICWRIQRETNWAIAFAESAIVYHRHRSTLADLRRQWYRYGCSNRYLNELHGIALTPSLSPWDYGHRLTRWMMKEVPRHLLDIARHKRDWIDLISTPLGLICASARSQGQQQAELQERAKEIEW